MLVRLCVLIALFAPMQSAAAQGAVGEPGSVRWFELLTEDATAAGVFYRDLFGWELQLRESGDYTVIHDGELIAGISQIERPRRPGAPRRSHGRGTRSLGGR